MTWVTARLGSIVGYVRAFLRDLLPSKNQPAKAPNQEKDHEAAPETEATAPDLGADLEEIRAHLRRLGAALAAGATALLVGLGWTQLHNLFPAPSSHPVLVPIVAFIGSVAALLGIGWLIQMIFSAQRRIPVASDTGRLGVLGSLTDGERRVRDDVFASVAEEQGMANLRELEREAHLIERQAENPALPEEMKGALRARSKRMLDAVNAAIYGAATLILEERSENVFRGKAAMAAFAMAALGIILAFGAADYSKGERDLIALRKSCAETAAAGVNDPCESIVDVDLKTEDGEGKETPTGATTIAVGVRTAGSGCVVTVRVNDKKTRAAKSGMAMVSINDRSRRCGVRVAGGGLVFHSTAGHTGTTSSQAHLKPISYNIVKLWVPPSTPMIREIRDDPLAVAP